MITVHKYTLDGTGHNKLMIPAGGEVLTAQMQDGRIRLWVKVNDKQIPVPRHFYVEGTGWQIEDIPLEYIATVQQLEFVWHVFELKG